MSAESDRIARAFLKEYLPWHREVHVSILHNAIDDCTYEAIEDDFISRALNDGSLRRPTLVVLKRAKPHMHNLVADAQGWATA
ncbi:MAG: hypothetical protein ABJ251_07035 [Paracoccaceae bacterium]